MWLVVLVLAAVGCKAYKAPQQVQDAAQHMLEDLVLAEKELLPFIPPDATLEFTTITGDTDSTNARQLWKDRLRSFMFRGAGLLAWSRGEVYDEQAAFAKLFPDRVKPPGDSE
jgi:hypothetical protein